ncbi:MAG: hypothetical protein ACRES2_06300 [Steroidobacteraceae bacterium]
MPRRNSPRSDNLRRAIAQEAARVMAEHGIQDFRTAKRKAAERFGVTEEGVLPSNTEVETSLVEYQRLFAADTHNATLRSKRGVALRAMRSLAAFSPRVVGPVLHGTATAHNDVQLHLFTDQPEAVALNLLDRGVEHDVGEHRLRLDAERFQVFPSVQFEIDSHTIDATVFPVDGIRQSPISPVDGRPMRRADADELASLLDDDIARPR